MLFPGQGSQYVGMLSSFFKHDHVFRQTFDEASQNIHIDLFKIIQEGPKKKLAISKYTQPAILTSSVAIYRYWSKLCIKSPKYMSGHSLGEYSALVCANSIKFSDALKIVFLRGKLMQKVAQNRSSLMHAVIGTNKEIIKTACKDLKKNEIVSIASINAKNQIVLSGDYHAVNRVSAYCKQRGAKNIIDINLKIPAHCNILKPASQKLKILLKNINVKKPKIPVINNVDVKSEMCSHKIKNALIRQMYNTVRWKEIIDFITFKKVSIMLEIGPNKILTNLNKMKKNIISCNTSNLKNFLIALNTINTKKNEY